MGDVVARGLLHSGPAVLTLSAFRLEGIACGVGCFTDIQSLFASTGPIPVRLT